jgi:hypothetical protein
VSIARFATRESPPATKLHDRSRDENRLEAIDRIRF